MSALPYLLEQCPEFTLPCPNKYTIKGYSKAGERTGFWLSPLNIVLDAGMITMKLPSAVFITHVHPDHAG